MLEHSHPSYQHAIPDPRSMNIGKLGSGGALMLITCNGVRKMRRLIVEQVRDAAEALRKDDSDEIRDLEFECWNHLRNVRLGGVTKSKYNLIGNTLREELD